MKTELPSGLVTFLFSDIEGSTRLLDDLGAPAYSAVQEVHRSLLREAFDAHDGAEVNTEGDSFFVAFASPTGGVGAALTAQLALARHDWGDGPVIRVRIGLHTGEATAKDGDYTSIAVNSAARISSAAHGGQTLVSASTQQHVGKEFDAEVAPRRQDGHLVGPTRRAGNGVRCPTSLTQPWTTTCSAAARPP